MAHDNKQTPPADEGPVECGLGPEERARLDALLDHIYEHGTAAEGVLRMAAQLCEAARAAERAESARLRQLLNLARDDYNTAAQRLQDIGDYAHDNSTGPAVPDVLWEVRSMAYGA